MQFHIAGYRRNTGIQKDNDDQTAATATTNLQALGLEQETLKKMTQGVIGAWSRYGDSIPNRQYRTSGLTVNSEFDPETMLVAAETGAYALTREIKAGDVRNTTSAR